jgi:Ca-activated chloride channel family protein
LSGFDFDKDFIPKNLLKIIIMKNLKLISLALSMLISFVIKAQEKQIPKEISEKKATEITDKSFTKTKDTISKIELSPNLVQPAVPVLPKKIIICAVSRPLLNEPLTILDGVLIDSKQFSKVNPNDIENIKVLKGIDATSIYGSRAINGVIIITTKEKD